MVCEEPLAVAKVDGGLHGDDPDRTGRSLPQMLRHARWGLCAFSD
jgi:hypothetical protein